MKVEQEQLMVFLGKMSLLIIFAALYAIGGSGDFWGGQLWIRRWLGTFLLSLVAYFVSGRDWRYLVAFPLIAGSLTLPYGSDILGEKIALRAMCGAAAGLAFNAVNLSYKRWVLAAYGFGICVVTSVVLGVFNPTPDAIVEQGSIAMIFGFTYMIGLDTNKKEA